MEDAKAFLGRGFAFPPRVDSATGRFVMKNAEEDIQESIYIIIMTKKGERAMLPDFGCNIHNYIFSLPNAASMSQMRSEIISALTRWEPRIHNIDVSVDLREIIEGRVILRIAYVVRSTNNPNNLVFPYYLQEGVGRQ